MFPRRWLLGARALTLVTLGAAPLAQGFTVGSERKYTQQCLDPFDGFGSCMAGIGDLDGDGIDELAVGAPGDDDGGGGEGAVWILFLNGDGSVRAQQKISELSGRLEADLFVDNFGAGVAGLGDLDGDGVPDLAVAAPYTNATGTREGAAWILFLRRDGTVRAWTQVAPLTSLDGARLGQSISCVGDVDGNGAVDIALGDMFASDGVFGAGAVWLLFLGRDGTLLGEQKIGHGRGGFGGALDSEDRFGVASAAPGDLDGDGIPELAVGALRDDDGGTDVGALWILFLTRDGTVRSWQKISATEGGFGGALRPGDAFGAGLCALGDVDGDGRGDLAVGASGADDGGADKGALWILHLGADGRVRSERKISATDGGFGGTLEEDPFYRSSSFGAGIAALGDIDGNGFGDLGVGTPGYGTAAQQNTDQGSAWVLRMGADDVVEHEREHRGTRRGWGSDRYVNGKFGSAAALLEDIDRDGVRDLAVGARDGGTTSSWFASGNGGTWILFLNPDGSVKSCQHLGEFGDGGFVGPIDHLDAFGCALASLGDLDGDGTGDVAVGAEGDDDGLANAGAVWILFLDVDGRVRAQQKISATEGGLGAPLYAQGRFGASLATLGPLPGGGVELAVGAPADDDGGNNLGALWILGLGGDGTVKTRRKISALAGGFGGTLHPGDAFGSSVARLGDLDGNGVGELAVGARGDLNGAVWILFLAPDGTVASEQRITASGNRFGTAVASLGDLDGDGLQDIAVGAPGVLNAGHVWILFLRSDGTVRSSLEVGERRGGFRGQLSSIDEFGASLTAADLDGNGRPDLLVGAVNDGDFGLYAGALWGLELEPAGRFVPSVRSSLPSPVGSRRR